MTVEAWLALILAACLLGYLTYSMLRPERF
ncbi:MAG TPA: K(+)-transporting ATPase subunit F [Gemmatimonadaceae bacterium]|nr:K(+)-transporting ATPase subunit F [Gemmatimonadaceae bacterium]